MSTLDPYVDKARSELDAIGAEIRKLKATAEEAGAEQRIRFARYVDDLEEHWQALGERVDSMKASGEDASEDLKQGLKDARDRLAIARRAAKARFH